MYYSLYLCFSSGEASYTSDGNTISLTGSAKKKSLFDLKPILKHDATSGDLEFVDTSDVVVVTGKAPPIRKTNPLDKFMKVYISHHMVMLFFFHQSINLFLIRE